MNRRRTTALCALLGASLLLAACGPDETTASAADAGSSSDEGHHGGDGHHGGAGHGDSATPVAEGAREIEVTATIQSFEPSEITAEAGEELAIVLTSEDMFHDLVIDELDFHISAGRGETATGGVAPDEPGTYTFYCSVPGHRGAGMEGALTVE